MSSSKIASVCSIVVLCLIVELSSSSFAQKTDDACIYPGDCYRHGPFGTNIGWGKCENKSAWRQRFIHTTNAERVRMRKARGKTFDKRILGAYELTMKQREYCDMVREEFFEARRRKMGEKYNESKILLDQLTQRIQEYAKAGSELINGDDTAMSRLPNFLENADINDLRSRFQKIISNYPFDWSELADRIEGVLPPEQAKRGRARLAEKFPFTVSKIHGQKLSFQDAKSKNNKAGRVAAIPVDRWDTYVLAFEKRYHATPAQSTAIASILKELRESRAQLAASMVRDLKRYKNEENSVLANRRHEVFQLEVEDLFEVLKLRLNALLTTEQRQSSAE